MREPQQPFEEDYEETPSKKGGLFGFGKSNKGGDQRGKGSSKSSKGKKGVDKNDAKAGKGNALAGGRAGVVVARVVIMFLVGLLMLLGLARILTPSDSLDSAAVMEEIDSTVTYGGFPVASGSTYGLRFLDVVLNVDPSEAGQVQREMDLNKMAPGIDAAYFGVTPPVAQNIVDGPYVLRAPQYISPNSVTFFYTAKVESAGKQSWVYVAVPMYADGLGNVTVAGPLSYIPGGVVADLGPTVELEDNDFELVEEIKDTVIASFFTYWAASDSAKLALVILLDDPDTTPETYQGLGGAVSLSKVTDIYIPQAGADQDPRIRKAYVTVEWKQALNNSTVFQNYMLDIYQDDAGLWKVYGVEPQNQERTLPLDANGEPITGAAVTAPSGQPVPVPSESASGDAASGEPVPSESPAG